MSFATSDVNTWFCVMIALCAYGVRIASGNSAALIKIAHYVRREHTDCKGGVELQKR